LKIAKIINHYVFRAWFDFFIVKFFRSPILCQAFGSRCKEHNLDEVVGIGLDTNIFSRSDVFFRTPV